MKCSFLVLLTSFLFAGTYAQTTKNGLITGNLIEKENSKQIESATISIFNISAPGFQAITISDKLGGFIFENLPYGYYTLSIKMGGYATLKIDSIYIRAERSDFNLGDIRLTKSATALEEVIIYAEKPLFENKDGKITFNAGESALSNSATTTELLKQTPLVSVDTDGKILMRGKEIKILIDDKPVEMDGRQLQDLLESMPGSMIEKIEVLTTPPPQYANERGGVINIVTKKGRVGITSRVNINYGTRGEAGVNGNFSYRKNKMAMNLSAGYSYNQYRSNSYSTRENYYTDSSNIFKTTGRNFSTNKRPNARFTFDNELDKNNSYNITLLFNANDNSGQGTTQYSNINRFDVLYRLSNRDIKSNAESFNPAANLTFTHKGKDPSEIFKINAGLNLSRYENARNFYQQYLNPDYSFNGSDSSQQQNTFIKSHNFFVRINYDKPLNKKLFLNIGATANNSTSHNSLHTAFMKKPENVFLNNDLLSNNFWFYQEVYGLRGSVRYQFSPDFFANAGILEEYAKTSFNIINNVNHYNNHYFSPLPFINITKKWPDGYNITASYKRSIQRPGINNLNPSVDYSDPYNTRFGNPFLQPYFAENFDLGTGYWSKSYNLNISAGYNVIKQIYTSIRTLQPDGKTTTTWENLSGRKEFESSLWGGLTISPKAKANASIGYTYNMYSMHDRTVTRYHNGGSLNSSLNGNYQFNSLLNASGNFTYHRFANPQGTVRNAISMNMGIQQKLLKKNMTISINIIDPFRQQQNKNFINAPNYSLQSFSSSNSRNFRIAVGYTFKKAAKKSVKLKV